MSSKKNESALTKRMSAVEQYNAAFERLKHNRPERLPKGALVSQNNVAKEAGSDPSALKKSRFPLLIAEIQKYVEEHVEKKPTTAHQVRSIARKKNRTLRERIAEVEKQRDYLASLLSEGDAKILELYARITELERITSISSFLPIEIIESKKLEPSS